MCKERDEESEEKWKKIHEILEHRSKERKLQNELRTLKEERMKTENKTWRDQLSRSNSSKPKQGWSVRR